MGAKSEYFWLRRVLAVGLALILAETLTTIRQMAWSDPAANGDGASYAGSASCANCHKQIAANFATNPHAHTQHACESCHGSAAKHVAGNKTAIINPSKMKADAVNTLCLKCHSSANGTGLPVKDRISHRYWLASRHAQRGISCLSCHSVHQGQTHELKMQPPVLCTGCHADMKATAGVFQHKPVADGQCLECHSPHASQQPALLLDTVSTACAGCHDPKDPKFVQRHGGYDLQGDNCTSCHSAHMKDPAAAGLPSVQHEPFAQRKCTLCHQSASVSKTAALIVPVSELCVRCHADVAKPADKSAHLHYPVQQRFCLSCHDPHGSNQQRPPLFRASVGTTCLSCHADIATAMGKSYTHLPVQSGNCLICHDGHQSTQEHLLVSDPITLCKNCHQGEHKMTHPVGTGPNNKPIINPLTGRMMTCVSCHHEIHGGNHHYLTQEDWHRDLCTTCHKGGALTATLYNNLRRQNGSKTISYNRAAHRGVTGRSSCPKQPIAGRPEAVDICNILRL